MRHFTEICPFPESERKRLAARSYILWGIPTGGIGAEIGVFRGHFSEAIAKRLKPKKYYLIDPWTCAGETFDWGDAYTNFGALKTADARDEAVNRVRSASDAEVVVVEGYYPLCEDQIEEKLDWAYLDASHSFENTLNELRHIAKQMKPQGVIFGDDWQPDPAHEHHGVFRAVQQFSRTSNWQIVACGPGAQWKLHRMKRPNAKKHANATNAASAQTKDVKKPKPVKKRSD
ncbi:class I SAM-dependent methyltransferase [Shimia sp. MIT1388]|uniref:class I SAM-dependent methyltransferase n=1 Tax=Shimia sp. MIT1388 TaxID=3096992 RepID=UPI00399A67DC